MTTGFASVALLCGVLALLTSCGSSSPSSTTPVRGPDIVIPEASPTKARKDDADPPAPGGMRDPVVLEGDSDELEPEPGVDDDPWGATAGGGSRGGPDCDRAADCCMKLYQQMADPSVQRVCASLRIAPSTLCAGVLSSFQQSAPSLGLSCP